MTNVRVLVNVVRAFDIPVRVVQPQTRFDLIPVDCSGGRC